MSSDKDVTDTGPDDTAGSLILEDETLVEVEADNNGIQESEELIDAPVLENGDVEYQDQEVQSPSTPIAIPQVEEPSTPDDTPSLQDSILSSPRRPRLGSPSHSFRPFDRRFTARLSPSPLNTSRPASPAFLTGRSRQSSAFNPYIASENGDVEGTETPWEVFRWTKLRKLSGDTFSELGKRNYGRPTCMAVASLIAIGTSKGLILVFDFHQNLKTTIGLGTKAIESGAVTAIALSADYTIVAGGHANGNIFTWEIARPAKPFLSIISSAAVLLQGTGIDGHVIDTAVLHLGFLGTRHTALVSADVKGMAFSHLATRGLGAIARSVKTARILGRYPETSFAASKPKKPSSVLAFASMPLGNSESATDDLGLVAMLTPYLLVIVSTTPIAQTQHKASRPKELAAHGAMTGALAWYPAMKGKLGSSRPKLAYCWLNVVTIIEILEVENDNDNDAPPDLSFKYLKRWQTEESIVAMQWLNRSVLAILTITQQLIVLEDSSLAVTDSSDLIKRHVYHNDLFSQQLSHMIENLEQEDVSMHGVVADAFYMSFKAYKGRLFLLGFNDVSIGTLSNWADRLLALMEQGDFIGAIQLATSYYTGGPEKAAIGLPLDEKSRHELVEEKLVEMMSASLKYAFGKNPDADARVSDTQLEHLARACFDSCLQLGNLDFLFEEVYTWYSENDANKIFLDLLETSVIEEEIKKVPPIVLKDFVNSFVVKGENSRLEEILCVLDPATMDIDQITQLCRRFKLYDALFYIWSQAIGDYTTVLRNLLTRSQTEDENNQELLQSKVFPYLSYTLTGRVYPTGEWMPEELAFKAKAETYHFLFSGTGGKSYVHLRQILDLDASSFLSMLNEAYEDSFLDGTASSHPAFRDETEEERFSVALTRQYIIRVLLEVFVQPEYDLEDTIYLDMFIARNQPKFPQFIRLPGSVLQRVMVNLCLFPSEEVAEDCQLSLEYLLSAYQPPDITSLLPDLEKAKFYRVIKSIYRSEKQYSKLLEACFKDSDNPDGVFDCIRDCFGPGSGLTDYQRELLLKVLSENVPLLLSSDLKQAAEVIDSYVPSLQETCIEYLQIDERRQFQYLRQILEPKNTPGKESKLSHDMYIEKYVRLLCEYDPHHVSDYTKSLDTSNLQLEHILPALEQSGVIDAAVMLMFKSGDIRRAMDRLIQHLHYLDVALSSLVDGAALAPDVDNIVENTDDLVDTIEKYGKVGIWLCTNQQSAAMHKASASKAKKRTDRVRSHSLGEPLLPHETLWVDLLESIVRIAKNSNSLQRDTTDHKDSDSILQHDTFAESLGRLRNIVQNTFTALLTATSTSPKEGSHSNLSFLRILRAFLSRISESSPSLVHLRAVLSSVFSAYAYEENLLILSNRLLDKDLFVRVDEVAQRRRKGWRPSGQVCNGCQKRVWGPGTGADTWNAWFDNQERNQWRAGDSDEENATNDGGRTTSAHTNGFDREESAPLIKAKGKGKASAHPTKQFVTEHVDDDSKRGPAQSDESASSLIIFSCRHIWHRRCLQTNLMSKETTELSGTPSNELRCPLETIIA